MAAGSTPALASAAEQRRRGPAGALPAHHEPKAKHLIVIFLTGGFSHVDTFDYKPGLSRVSRQAGPVVRLAEPTKPATARCWARRFGSSRAASRAS